MGARLLQKYSNIDWKRSVAWFGSRVFSISDQSESSISFWKSCSLIFYRLAIPPKNREKHKGWNLYKYKFVAQNVLSMSDSRPIFSRIIVICTGTQPVDSCVHIGFSTILCMCNQVSYYSIRRLALYRLQAIPLRSYHPFLADFLESLPHRYTIFTSI